MLARPRNKVLVVAKGYLFFQSTNPARFLTVTSILSGNDGFCAYSLICISIHGTRRIGKGHCLAGDPCKCGPRLALSIHPYCGMPRYDRRVDKAECEGSPEGWTSSHAPWYLSNKRFGKPHCKAPPTVSIALFFGVEMCTKTFVLPALNIVCEFQGLSQTAGLNPISKSPPKGNTSQRIPANMVTKRRARSRFSRGPKENHPPFSPGTIMCFSL